MSPGETDAVEIQALLFDLGGVIIDIDFQRALDAWASAAAVDVKSIAHRFAFDEAYARHERGEISGSEYFDHLRSTLELDLYDSEFTRGWNSIYVGEMPGIRPVLAGLAQRLPLYALTNSNATHEQFWAREYHDLLRPFRRIFNSCALGCRKPEAEAFRVVSEEIGVELTDILFFDDLQENVVGAIDAGVRAVRVASAEDVVRATRWVTKKMVHIVGGDR